MKASMKSIIVLVGVCLVLSGLIAVVNSITAPIIKQNMNAQANASLLEIMPNGQNFKPVEFDPAKMPATVTEVQGEDGGGYVITLTTSGYGSGFVIMVGVNADGTISGTKCLASSETLGHEATYGANFTGKDAAGVDAVETVSGATKTTQAYKTPSRTR